MKFKTAVRKGLATLFTGGATLSLGFLSFAGMLVMTPSFFWCTAAFVLAAAYESQVNGEGIASALRRIFDPNRLKLGRVTKFLEDVVEFQQTLEKNN